MKEFIQLGFIQTCTAAVSIDREFLAVQTQIMGVDAVQLFSETQDLFSCQKVVSSYYDQVYVLRKSVCKSTDKICNTVFFQ